MEIPDISRFPEQILIVIIGTDLSGRTTLGTTCAPILQITYCLITFQQFCWKQLHDYLELTI